MALRLSFFLLYFVGQKTLLVDVNEEIEGRKSMFINDVAVAKDGAVYFTVTSTTFSLYEGVHAMLAPGDGRYASCSY